MHHLIPQAPCLVTATGDWAADYVVRTENLAEDMKEVSRAGRMKCLGDVARGCLALERGHFAVLLWCSSSFLFSGLCSSQVWQGMNARRLPGTPELDVESLLGQLTNVNKVHVACRGIPKNATATAAAAAAGAAAAAAAAGGGGGGAAAEGAAAAAAAAGSAARSGATLSKEIAAVA